MRIHRGDAYGHLLLNVLDGGDGEEIVERDDGFVDTGNVRLYFARPRQWGPEEREAMRYVRGRVLDVGAGAGRVCLAVQERGHEAVALDSSPGALEVCRRRGVATTALMPATGMSRRLGVFDTVVMFGNNWGLMRSPATARWLLGRLAAITSPRARILATTLDPYRTDTPEHVAYHVLNRRRGRAGGQVRLRVRFRSTATPWFDYLFSSPAEMADILAPTAWRLHRAIDRAPNPVYVAVIERRPVGTSG